MLVFWDIDGTLLVTARAGIYAWQDALRAVTGREADLSTFDTAGHPDYGIARRLLTDVVGKADPDANLVAALVSRYEGHLPEALPRRAGRVLPHVRDILERLAHEPHACSLLLTGNTRRGAAAKLRHYGLDGFFADGGFSDGVGDRIAIARAALARATAAGCARAPEETYVVGDTPHDIRCGQAIGARTIAVATGVHSIADLAAERPWRVVSELPAPDDFLALLAGRETVATQAVADV